MISITHSYLLLTRITILIIRSAGKFRFQLTGSQLPSTSIIGLSELPRPTMLTVASPVDGGRLFGTSYIDSTYTSYSEELFTGVQLQTVWASWLLYHGLARALSELTRILHPCASAEKKEKVATEKISSQDTQQGVRVQFWKGQS